MPWEKVAKASQGHDPLPFLISDIKNWCKDMSTFFYFPNIFFKIFLNKYQTLYWQYFSVKN